VVEGFDPTPATVDDTAGAAPRPFDRGVCPRPPRGDHLSDRSMW